MHNDTPLPGHIVDVDTMSDNDSDAPADTAAADNGEDWADVASADSAPRAALTDTAPAVPPVAVRPARPMPGLPAPVNVEHYAVLAGTLEEVQAANGALQPSDLDRITVPSGGGLAWSIPTLSGAATLMPVIEGVIAAWSDRRAFWARPIGENAGSPPDCASRDGVRGDGNPGGDCALCPHAQFGSAGRGQACRLTRELLLFVADSHLPLLVAVPPSSHAIVARFLRRLPVPAYQAVVRLGLEQARSDAGIRYSVIRPQFVGPLDAASRERFAALHRQLVAATAS